MLNRRHVIIGIGALHISETTFASDGQEVSEIHMYNTTTPNQPNQKMVFTPRILRIKQGAKVNFIPNNLGHNTQSTTDMIPKGVKPWNSPFGKHFSITLTKPGYYGYHCLAHRSMGMVGLIIVEGKGMNANYKSARNVKHHGRAAKVWKEIWAT